MSDTLRIKPATLRQQSQQLRNLYTQLNTLQDKTRSTVNLMEDALSARFSLTMNAKATSLLRKMKDLSLQLDTAAQIAQRCADTYENADKVIRDTIGDSLPDEVMEAPVSNQEVFVASGPLDGTPRITSPYGPRNLYGNFHYGIDFGVPTGTPVKSVVSGTIMAAYTQSGGGNCIYLLGDDGYLYEYAHLSAFNCTQGARVEAGTVIASSGATGQYVTGPHLHFGIYKADQALKNTGKQGSSNLKWKTDGTNWWLDGSVDPKAFLSETYDIHY